MSREPTTDERTLSAALGDAAGGLPTPLYDTTRLIAAARRRRRRGLVAASSAAVVALGVSFGAGVVTAGALTDEPATTLATEQPTDTGSDVELFSDGVEDSDGQGVEPESGPYSWDGEWTEYSASAGSTALAAYASCAATPIDVVPASVQFDAPQRATLTQDGRLDGTVPDTALGVRTSAGGDVGEIVVQVLDGDDVVGWAVGSAETTEGDVQFRTAALTPCDSVVIAAAADYRATAYLYDTENDAILVRDLGRIGID